MADRDLVPLPLEIRARLAELELELSEGTWLLLPPFSFSVVMVGLEKRG